MARKHIHISDMRTFKGCSVRWYFSSPLRMGRSPVKQTRAPWLGTLVHRALDEWYGSEKQTDPVEALDEIIRGEIRKLSTELTKEQLDEIHVQAFDVFTTAEEVLAHYVEWADAHDGVFGQILATEQDFIVPIRDTGVDFAGRFDMVFRNPLDRNKIWINDFKVTGASFSWFTEYLSTLDEQARAYAWAARTIWGPEFGGVMFTIIRNKAPHEPAVLKSGKLSRNKSQDTTWPKYKAALLALGEDPADYDDMRVVLTERVQAKPFVARVEIRPNEHTTAMFEHQAAHIAPLMVDPQVPIWPNASFMNCNMCPFKMPCSLAHTVGWEHAEAVLNTEYARGRYVREAIALMDDSNGD